MGGKAMRLLVVDIGGNNVKPAIVRDGKAKRLEPLKSSRKLGPGKAVAHCLKHAGRFDRVVVGYPGVVKDGAIRDEPANLGKGWRGYDFSKAFGRPTTIVNDAAMQALGSYGGAGRMLFLGLGYGLGTAIVEDWWVTPLEAGHLPGRGKRTFEELVGTRALEALKHRRWQRNVLQAVEKLGYCLLADSVVIGGGNSKRLTELPERATLGDNENAFLGGWRLVNGHE